MINALGAHIYAGGFTLGVAQHFNVLGHLEHEAYGAEVVRLNFPDLPIYAGGPRRWPASWPEPVHFMFSNPHCAIWSGASSTAQRWQADPRLKEHHDIFNYAMDIVNPDIFVLESIPLSFTRGRSHIDSLIACARSYGYAATVVRHNAQWFGVPQSRQRIFYTFHKVIIPWEIPAFSPPVTVEAAWRSLPRPGKGYALPTPAPVVKRVLTQAAEGAKLRFTCARQGRDPSPFSFLHRRLFWDRPAPVPLEVYHPTEDRRLTQNEFAAICSFPFEYKWPNEKYAVIAYYMNRGVMPKVAEWLAWQVCRGLLENQRLNDLTPKVFDIVKPPGVCYVLE